MRKKLKNARGGGPKGRKIPSREGHASSLSSSRQSQTRRRLRSPRSGSPESESRSTTSRLSRLSRRRLGPFSARLPSRSPPCRTSASRPAEPTGRTPSPGLSDKDGISAGVPDHPGRPRRRGAGARLRATGGMRLLRPSRRRRCSGTTLPDARGQTEPA